MSVCRHELWGFNPPTLPAIPTMGTRNGTSGLSWWSLRMDGSVACCLVLVLPWSGTNGRTDGRTVAVVNAVGRRSIDDVLFGEQRQGVASNGATNALWLSTSDEFPATSLRAREHASKLAPLTHSLAHSLANRYVPARLRRFSRFRYNP